jgi:hypothetical protein
LTNYLILYNVCLPSRALCFNSLDNMSHVCLCFNHLVIMKKDTRGDIVLPRACTHCPFNILYYVRYYFDSFDHCHYSVSCTFVVLLLLSFTNILHSLDLCCIELVYAMAEQLYTQTLSLLLLTERKDIDIDFFSIKPKVNLRFIRIVNHSFSARSLSLSLLCNIIILFVKR